MKKHINFSVSSIIIILSLFVGVEVYANENTTTSNEPVACTMDAKLCPDGSYVGRVGPNCEFAKCPGITAGVGAEVNANINVGSGKADAPVRAKVQGNIEERKEIREENQEKRETVRAEIKNISVENKAKLEAMVTAVKEQRQLFKADLEIKREEAQTRMAAIKTQLKADLGVIKNENKKALTEKIVSSLLDLNIKLTTNLSTKVDQIENVLVSIQSRITKGEEKGLNVASVKAEVEKAKVEIKAAREAISAQTAKKYDVIVTSETVLQAEVRFFRDRVSSDIRTVREQVKTAHTAVKNVATSLAKIKGIDGDVEVEAEVEVNSTTSVN